MDCEIAEYQRQLQAVRQQLKSCETLSQEREVLLQLEKDLVELLELTQDGSTAECEGTLDDEYELFREAVGLNDDNAAAPSADCELVEQNDLIRRKLNDISGSKCKSPFRYAWNDEVVYHNALVYKLEKESKNVGDAQGAKVRVLFTNPTHKEMKPCPFYLDGHCRFEEEQCRFSHGEVVLLEDLRDYRMPDYSLLDKGSCVLAKQDDGLWHRAVILSTDDDTCCIRLENNSKVEETHLQNILPLESTNSHETETADVDEPKSSVADDATDIVRRIFDAPPTGNLGSWEQHTKGVGSRIMAKMGYVHGSGLGPEGLGRVEPVPALVYPSGKSLDHCLMLKERAGGDENMFKAEKKMRRDQRKHEKAMHKAYEKEKQRTDVFTFLNDQLNQKESEESKSESTHRSNSNTLRKESQHGLNINNFKLAEDFRKTEKEMKILNKSLERHTSGSPIFTAIKEKIQNCEKRLTQLQASERRISDELRSRQDRKKLAVF